jgi:hypothetical protein
MQLNLSQLPITRCIDQLTRSRYRTQEQAIIDLNRLVYGQTGREIKIGKYYFRVVDSREQVQDTGMYINFKQLRPYRTTAKPQPDNGYAFCALETDTNQLLWFFGGKPLAITRPVAIETFCTLNQYLKTAGIDAVLYAYKKRLR